MMQTMSVPVEGLLTSTLAPLNRHLTWYVWPAINVGAKILSSVSASMILASARKLQRDALTLRGSREAVLEADPARLIDPKGAFLAALNEAEVSLVNLHGLSLKKRQQSTSDTLRVVFNEVASIALSVCEEVTELRIAVSTHEEIARAGVRPLEEAGGVVVNLAKNDDVTPARRAALQALVRRSIERETVEDKTGDPAPL